jgi:hypothetical protein
MHWYLKATMISLRTLRREPVHFCDGVLDTRCNTATWCLPQKNLIRRKFWHYWHHMGSEFARNIVWDRRGLECCKKKSWKGGKNCRYLKLARSLIIYLLWRKLRKTDVTIYLILLPCPMKLHQGGPIRGGMWPLVTRNLVLVVYNWLAGRKSATRLLSWPQQRFFTVRSLRTESAPLAPGSSGARLMY